MVSEQRDSWRDPFKGLLGGTMIPPLDVFSVKDNVPSWLGAAESLVHALEMVRKNGAGSYCVFSHQTGNKTMYHVDATGTIRPDEYGTD